MGKIWILFREIPYTFGEIINCYTSKEEATADFPENGYEEYEIQEWDLDSAVRFRGTRRHLDPQPRPVKRYKVKDGEVIRVNAYGVRVGQT